MAATKIVEELRRDRPPGQPAALAEPLTHREEEILRLLARGQSNKEIAEGLHLTEGTVKNYISRIYAKLGARDRTQAALWAVEHRLLNE